MTTELDTPSSLATPTATEHAFAQYIRILGKGKTGTRSLTFDEAHQAFGMILRGEALDLQTGAFLMLLRVKAESVDEMAGFVQACRDQFDLPQLTQPVHVDWSSYAGKRKHYPWFVLAALTLAHHGINVVMHGASGHTAHRLYTEQALASLGITPCVQLDEIDQHLAQRHFAFVPLPLLSPRLAELMAYRAVLGVRSPVHSLVRLLNPFDADATLQAIFHPAYRPIHQQTALRLGYQNSMVIKGEGGEFERNPDARTLLCGVRDGNAYELELPKLNDQRSEAELAFDQLTLTDVWQGRVKHPYAEQAITETLAIVLLTLKRANDYPDALQLAQHMWHDRFNGTGSV